MCHKLKKKIVFISMLDNFRHSILFCNKCIIKLYNIFVASSFIQDGLHYRIPYDKIAWIKNNVKYNIIPTKNKRCDYSNLFVAT